MSIRVSYIQLNNSFGFAMQLMSFHWTIVLASQRESKNQNSRHVFCSIVDRCVLGRGYEVRSTSTK